VSNEASIGTKEVWILILFKTFPWIKWTEKLKYISGTFGFVSIPKEHQPNVENWGII
jgi:hypothetical protein